MLNALLLVTLGIFLGSWVTLFLFIKIGMKNWSEKKVSYCIYNTNGKMNVLITSLLFLPMMVFVGVLTAYCAVMDWRSRRAWEKYQARSGK
ncbi:MAG: hypothetical protein A3D57_03905 [Candidatus Sungbacteria bacterium RIFCSPHIGHO2_02_FULL_46_12]|nr:MAG: hypothetical protein A3D57_03905 [Candidatus Sungbacteria bacterium RIFCSPHIGHO2_02_FULL_46_12]